MQTEELKRIKYYNTLVLGKIGTEDPPGLIYGTQANLAAIGNQTLIECPPQKMDLC